MLYLTLARLCIKQVRKIRLIKRYSIGTKQTPLNQSPLKSQLEKIFSSQTYKAWLDQLGSLGCTSVHLYGQLAEVEIGNWRHIYIRPEMSSYPRHQIYTDIFYKAFNVSQKKLHERPLYIQGFGHVLLLRKQKILLWQGLPEKDYRCLQKLFDYLARKSDGDSCKRLLPTVQTFYNGYKYTTTTIDKRYPSGYHLALQGNPETSCWSSISQDEWEAQQRNPHIPPYKGLNLRVVNSGQDNWHMFTDLQGMLLRKLFEHDITLENLGIEESKIQGHLEAVKFHPVPRKIAIPDNVHWSQSKYGIWYPPKSGYGRRGSLERGQKVERGESQVDRAVTSCDTSYAIR